MKASIHIVKVFGLAVIFAGALLAAGCASSRTPSSETTGALGLRQITTAEEEQILKSGDPVAKACATCKSVTYLCLIRNWRKQANTECHTELAGGVNVLKEQRILPGIGREFMPPLDEGSFLYMPSLLPQAGLGPALEVNSKQDLAIASVAEVESVVGKIGRAESALDPAPIGMMESIVILKPESEWRHVPMKRWFASCPGWLKKPLACLWPEHRRITKNEILAELQEKTAIPGVLPTWLQPIQTRLVMLQTGFRAMMGVKICGSDLKEIERIGLEIEQLLKQVPGATDIVADRIVGKPYLQFEIDRDRIARYGINIRDVQDVIESEITDMRVQVYGRFLAGQTFWPTVRCLG